jgi:hypothetical protein
MKNLLLNFSPRRALLCAAVISTLSFSTAYGIDWNVDANGNWNTAANWSPATVPNAVGAVATFGPAITTFRTVTVNGSFTVGQMDFNGLSGYNYEVRGPTSGVGTITFDVASDNASLNVTGAGPTLGQNAVGPGTSRLEFVLNDNLVITNNSSGIQMDIYAGMSGTGSVTYNGTGQTYYTKPTSSTSGYYAGNTIINSGTLILSSAAPGVATDIQIGASPQVILNGGSLVSSTNDIHNGAQMVLNGGNWTLGGASTTTETVQSLTLSVNSNITLGNPGELISRLTFTGGVNYTGGILFVNSWGGSLGGGGNDRIIFGTTVSQAFLNNVFWSPLGILGARQLASGEIVPVPEPGSILGGIGLAALAIGYEIRRRRQKNLA